MNLRNYQFFLVVVNAASRINGFAFHSAHHVTISPQNPSTAFSAKRARVQPVGFKLHSTNNEKPETAPLEKIDVTDEKIAEMLEVTFIKSCLQLATGYVDVLKLFLAAANAAYDRGIPVPQLIQDVADCPVNTANRKLLKEEISLRSDWIMIAYLTLETIDRLEDKKNIRDLSIPEEIRERFGVTIEKKVGEKLGLESSASSADDVMTPSDPAAAAVFAYNMKIITLTISNVEEARLADQKPPTIDEDGVGPPRPSIPGTS